MDMGYVPNLTLNNLGFAKKYISAGGLKTRQTGQQGRRAESINVPALTADIFTLATNRTNIPNKTGSAPR